VRVYMHINWWQAVDICMYIYGVCVCVCICTHTHTHTHTNVGQAVDTRLLALWHRKTKTN
jgi:hypothetical protein